MKLAEHNILSLRCAMTQLGYRWRWDRHDLSPRWSHVDHWELWDQRPGYDFRQLDLHPVVVCEGDLITTEVVCAVQVRPDGSLGEWLLMENYAGTSIKELDPWAYSLEDLPDALRGWVTTWDAEERSSSA